MQLLKCVHNKCSVCDIIFQSAVHHVNWKTSEHEGPPTFATRHFPHCIAFIATSTVIAIQGLKVIPKLRNCATVLQHFLYFGGTLLRWSNLITKVWCVTQLQTQFWFEPFVRSERISFRLIVPTTATSLTYFFNSARKRVGIGFLGSHLFPTMLTVAYFYHILYIHWVATFPSSTSFQWFH